MDKVRQIQHLTLMSHETKLIKFLESKKKELGGSVPLADKIGVSDRAVDSWLSGERHPKPGSQKKIEEAFGVTYKDIINFGEPQKDSPVAEDYVAIPYVSQEAQGGSSGRVGGDRKIMSYLAFSRQWVFSKGDPSKMEVLRVRGDSMQPTVSAGDIVLVDRSQNDLIYGWVFLVRHDGDVKIKRIRAASRGDGSMGLSLLSDNPDYPPEEVKPGDDFDILGRVIWRASEVP